MDRDRAHIPRLQIDFIDHIVAPLYKGDSSVKGNRRQCVPVHLYRAQFLAAFVYCGRVLEALPDLVYCVLDVALEQSLFEVFTFLARAS